ncbi:MAG TPA: PadR family transcriptional regulator [Candidatus Saccharimonadia bacterium]|jgi:DNA-binding PadR family transcriptional regulator|nr:PadR family transcriptional regulator [Candidatus Saccharimonadia bacterium]
MNSDTSYIEKLLTGWEDVYKHGQLTLWIMLALKHGPKHMAEIKAFITDATGGTLSADDKSMYRALRRYYDTELVSFTATRGNGPDLKIYNLSPIGAQVLEQFLSRNVRPIFYQPLIKNLIERNKE